MTQCPQIEQGKSHMKLLSSLTAFLAVLFFATYTVAELSHSHDVTAEYSVDNEKTIMHYEPEIEWNQDQLGLSIGTLISIYDSSATDSFMLLDTLDEGNRPNINVELTYNMGDMIPLPLEVYGKTGWDIDASERTDIKLGATISF